jgi:leucyl-tRNA synthetase
VNFCSKCDTVLANEQVHNGKCWRHTDTDVEIKHLEQWFVKTTDYAEELLNDIEKLQWPERIKIMQRNWIGKSQGVEIMFELDKKYNFVLLHGYTGSPEKNFFPWLKGELEKRGHRVSVPKLPNTNKPNIPEQIEYIIKHEKFDENTILLGHSLGSVIALKVLEKLNKPIKKLILAAGLIEPNSKDKPYVNTFDWKFDVEKIKKNIKEIVILKDTNDKEIRKDAADKIKSAIGGELIDFQANEEHICGTEEPQVLSACIEKIPIFTTRPDTLYGVTFLVMSAQHPQLMDYVTEKQKHTVENFLKKIKSTSEKELLEKEGVFTGSYAINPINNEKIPILAGNFVVADYGSGIVMAVPAHDQRDFEFAEKYKVPKKLVITPEAYELKLESMTQAYTGEGRLMNSEEFDGWHNKEAINGITKYLEEQHKARKIIQYKLRDWLVSRQRYWGTPIPIVYCKSCGIVPLPEKNLPVLLPEKVTFGKGNPLAANKKFVETKCPKCKQKAKRETDTMDTFFDSSWYFLRFTDAKNSKQPFDKEKVKYFMPVDQYIGGAEHACMHLIYARFFTKALRDLSFLNFNEPFTKLFNQGMLHGEDGFVMSKSRGNVVLPEEVSKKYGIDTARLFLVSVASPDKDVAWSEKGIEGSFRFVKKLCEYFQAFRPSISSKRIESKINKAIKLITEDIQQFRYNLAVIKIRELCDVMTEEQVNRKDAESFLKLLHPFCPHITEELWSRLKNKKLITQESWPQPDETKIDENLEKQDKMMETVAIDILNIIRIIKEKQGKETNKIYLYVIPNEYELYNRTQLMKKIEKEIIIYKVNDPTKHDPENKSSKAKPGKPGIYVE